MKGLLELYLIAFLVALAINIPAIWALGQLGAPFYVQFCVGVVVGFTVTHLIVRSES